MSAELYMFIPFWKLKVMKNVWKHLTKIKKHSRTSPDAQLKKVLLTKQKLDPERTMNELGKPILKNKKKSDKKLKKQKKQCQNAACEPLARNRHLVQTKN